MLGKHYILSPYQVSSVFVFNATGSSYVAQAGFEPALFSHMLRLQSCDPTSSPAAYFVTVSWDLLEATTCQALSNYLLSQFWEVNTSIPFTEMKTESTGSQVTGWLGWILEPSVKVQTRPLHI